MSQPTWIKIADELPPIGEWVWFRCCDLDGEDWYHDPDVGRFVGDETLGAAISMETLPDDYQSDWYPCTEWTRDNVIDGVTVEEKIEQNKLEMVEYKL